MRLAAAISSSLIAGATVQIFLVGFGDEQMRGGSFKALEIVGQSKARGRVGSGDRRR